MPTIDDLKKSNFITQKDVETPILATITGWKEINFAKDGTDPDMGYALTFRETDKPLSLNPTKGQVITQICQIEKALPLEKAKDFNNWKGLQIVIYQDPNYVFSGRVTGQICVRAPKKKPGTVTSEPAIPEPEQEFDPTEPEDDDSIPF